MEELSKLLENSDLKLIEKRTGIPYDRMYKWRRGLAKPKTADYTTLMDYFNGKSSINTLQEPEVIRPSGNITTLKANKRKSNALIPFYNADFMAGSAEEFYEDGVIHPEYFMDVPEFAGCTAFRNYGDSMEPKIRSGAILFGYKVDGWQDHLEYGQIYGITCTDRRRYLKYIRRAENNNRIFLLRSENPNYDDFELPKTKIKNIWLIEGWLDKRT